jgi:hypothetical protein
MSSRSPDDDHVVIFVTCFRHWKTGKLIRRADGRPFPLKVKAKKHKDG